MKTNEYDDVTPQTAALNERNFNRLFKFRDQRHKTEFNIAPYYDACTNTRYLSMNKRMRSESFKVADKQIHRGDDHDRPQIRHCPRPLSAKLPLRLLVNTIHTTTLTKIRIEVLRRRTV